MEQALLYLETHSTDPYYNLAFEEYVLKNRTEGAYLILWQNDRAVVVGRNQNTAAEIDRAFAERHGIRIVRRETGGGAVYHDLGNLNYSFIADMDGSAEACKRRLAAPVVDALRTLGLDASATGRNDILVDDCKVSGTAQRIYRKRMLHHGTLLFDADVSMAAGVLRPDPEKFRSRAAKSVSSRVGNIRSYLKTDMDIGKFWEYLKTALARNGLASAALGAEELAAVDELADKKYRTWEWNFGRSPAYTFRNKRKWPGGILETGVSVENGKITDISFQGDFLAMLPLDALTEKLKGRPFSREAVAAALAGVEVGLLFGGIEAEEVLATLFPE